MSREILSRDIESVKASFVMDPHRKEIYVEGFDDVNFITWLAGDSRDDNVLIQDMTSIKIDSILKNKAAGNKEKAICFSEYLRISRQNLPILFFVDADYDRVLGKKCGDNVLFTDQRDLEGYFFSKDVIEKIKYACKLSFRTDCTIMLKDVKEVAHYISCCRIFSYAFELKLPFKETSLDKYITVVEGNVFLKKEEYVRALMQNAGISLRHWKCFVENIECVCEEFVDADRGDMFHGKDALILISKILGLPTRNYDESVKIFRAAFEKAAVREYPFLTKVLSLVCGQAAFSY